MNTNNSLRVFAATMTIVMAVPLTTHAIVSAMGGHYSETLQERALGNQANIRAQTRALTRLNARCQNAPEDTKDLSCRAYLVVQKECLARQGLRTSTGCPEINDIARIAELEAALVRGEDLPAAETGDSASVSSAHAAAAAVSWDDLTQSQRLTLRRLIRLRYCSTRLPLVMYTLCTEAVGSEQGTVPTGLLNDLAKVQADQQSSIGKSLRDRIEMTAPRAK
ncbi:MAG: hypothetical protein PHS73_04115 [Candidatus Peribacteraceae bacterium]|nr:hypothetical protein [Candidatus Peribacteraceae bacterium]